MTTDCPQRRQPFDLDCHRCSRENWHCPPVSSHRGIPMKKRFGFSFAVLVGLGLMVSLSVAQSQSGPEVVNEIYHDTSQPVSQHASGLPLTAPALRVRPLPRRVLPVAAGPAQADVVEQFSPLPAVSAAISHNFDCMPDSANGSLRGVPPDENLSVGATQVVEVINTAYQVFNKSTGTSVQGPRQISSIFTGVSGLCGQGPTSPNYTDPIVLYDKQAGRWFIAIVAANSSFGTGNQCIAVSSTSDATGAYHRYAFSFGTNVFNDYDKFGVWPGAYYGAFNLFSPTRFLGARACAFQRAATGTCIPQSGTTDQLDSLGDRLMFRSAYRNFGSHESLVVNHAAKTSVAASGVRWYELRNPNATPVVFQQGTLTNGATSLWMGSIAMDKVGDLALGFSESSSTIHPTVAFTGRTPSDPLGTMEGITTIFAGPGSQTGGTANGGDRWGDYSGMAIDPSTDCTFWYVNEYIPSNGNFNFHTRIASFKFPTCI